MSTRSLHVPRWHAIRCTKSVELDVAIRRAALLAIPLIAGGLYLLREPKPQPTAPASSGSEPLGLPPTDLPQGIQERGEAAYAQPKSEPKPQLPSVAARDLPVVRPPSAGRSEAPSAPPPSPFAACGGIVARGITAADDPKWAFASLSPAAGQDAVIRRVGDRIGSWAVDSIEWDRVWLKGGGGRCSVGMHAGAREAQESQKKLKKGKKPLLSDDGVEEKPWRLPGEIANSIENVSETHFSIEKEMFDSLFVRAGDLVTGAKLAPTKRDESVIGLTLDEVRVDSVFQRFGVETGDVVVAIDGEAFASLEQIGKALIAARERERVVARLERRGEAFELTLVVR
jgi:type II secretory pathway component PulC